LAEQTHSTLTLRQPIKVGTYFTTEPIILAEQTQGNRRRKEADTKMPINPATPELAYGRGGTSEGAEGVATYRTVDVE
jgi:hypothetical protein